MQKLRLGILFLVVSIFLTSSITTSFALPQSFHASGAFVEDKEILTRAKVLSLIDAKKELIPNTNTYVTSSQFKIEIIEGELTGRQEVVTDSAFRIEEGDTVYIRYTKTQDGTEYFSIFEVDRSKGLMILFGIFVVTVLIIGKKQGLLSLIALFISFGFIFKLLFPQMIYGGNIILIATTGALLSLFVVMFVTHGFSRLTVSAYLGCTLSVLATLLLALYATTLTSLTGFATEESVFLNLTTKGELDFVALLIGGIIIGVIGVIDDISITQASVVGELKNAGSHLSRKELYIRAMKVGKDHMGAVINTLILAYTGASLPLLLYLYLSPNPLHMLVNGEIVTTEIVRTLVGSTGLLLAVPLTTLIAVFLMKEGDTSSGSHAHHHHSH
jgi:uncharacterized membrane protein